MAVTKGNNADRLDGWVGAFSGILYGACSKPIDLFFGLSIRGLYGRSSGTENLRLGLLRVAIALHHFRSGIQVSRMLLDRS